MRTGGMAPLDIINGPADGGDARGRTPLQCQRADRRRGAPVGRGDEGRRQSPREVHGEDGRLAQGQGPPRDRQGRRARHREEPRRDHPLEQRLRGRQPRHQGAAREARRGLRRRTAGPDRALGAAGQERAADGDDGAGPDVRRRLAADARRGRGAVAEIHRPPDRAGVRRPRRLRGGRHARTRARGPHPLGRGCPRRSSPRRPTGGAARWRRWRAPRKRLRSPRRRSGAPRSRSPIRSRRPTRRSTSSASSIFGTSGST